MNEEKGGGRRQLEVPEVAPTAPQQRGGPGETVAASQAGGGPGGSQAVPCQLSRPRFPLLSGVLVWPELLVSLGRGVRSEEQASQAPGLRCVCGGVRWGLGWGCPALLTPLVFPPQVEPLEAHTAGSRSLPQHRDLCLSSNSCLQRPR